MRKSISTILMTAIYKIDTFIYKKFGFVSMFRRETWETQAERIQKKLNYEHELAEEFNKKHNTCYTTKKALQCIEKERKN